MTVSRTPGWFFLVTALLFGLVPSTEARAAKEGIANLSNEVLGNDEILVSANLIRWDKKEIVEDINNGIPKDLFYYVLLKKRIRGWYDEEILAKTIRHFIKYDVLKKQYRVTTVFEGEKTERTFETFEEMANLISKIERVKIKNDRRLRQRHTYYTSVKAEMRASKTPFYLKYIFFFIPVLELDTPWANSAPFYAIDGAE